MTKLAVVAVGGNALIERTLEFGLPHPVDRRFDTRQHRHASDDQC